MQNYSPLSKCNSVVDRFANMGIIQIDPLRECISPPVELQLLLDVKMIGVIFLRV